MAQATASTRDRILEQGLALMSQAGLAGVTLGVLLVATLVSFRIPLK